MKVKRKLANKAKAGRTRGKTVTQLAATSTGASRDPMASDSLWLGDELLKPVLAFLEPAWPPVLTVEFQEVEGIEERLAIMEPACAVCRRQLRWPHRNRPPRRRSLRRGASLEDWRPSGTQRHPIRPSSPTVWSFRQGHVGPSAPECLQANPSCPNLTAVDIQECPSRAGGSSVQQVI
jgi:hypothetical protein